MAFLASGCVEMKTASKPVSLLMAGTVGHSIGLVLVQLRRFD